MERILSSPVNVILVDDHAVVRAGIRQFIECSPEIRVAAEASNGDEACLLIDNTPLDVAVLDIQMPGMNGIELAAWIRSQHPDLGILMLTAYDDEPYIQAALRAGANGYVLKTSCPEDIILAVMEVYEGKLVLDAALNQTRLILDQPVEGPTPADVLTEREVEVLVLAGKGLTNNAIGYQLGISGRTVQNHLAHIFAKLGSASRTEAVMRAVSLGLLPSSHGGGIRGST